MILSALVNRVSVELKQHEEKAPVVADANASSFGNSRSLCLNRDFESLHESSRYRPIWGAVLDSNFANVMDVPSVHRHSARKGEGKFWSRNAPGRESEPTKAGVSFA